MSTPRRAQDSPLCDAGTSAAFRGRSRTCPIDDSTMKSSPRKREIVRALAGDSTITRGLATGNEVWQSGRGLSNGGAGYGGSAVDPKSLIETFGTLGLLAIVFAETGLLVGFFLPGDSLLVFAGLVCATHPKDIHLNLALVLVGCSVAAIAGAQTGYFIGARAGPALFRRPESRLFKREYVDKAEHYFERFGGRTIVIARFIPIVRTFANPVAGVSRMSSRQFAVYNAGGGLLWVV